MGLSHNSPIRIPFSVVPAGSGNGLCHSLGWKTCLDSIRNIVSGVATPIDAVECFQPATATRCYSFLSQSWGAVADVDFGSEKHRWMGEIRFTVTALQKIVTKKEYQCKDNDPAWNGDSFDLPKNWTVVSGNHQVMIACNVPMISSDMKPAPSAKINDGLIHLLYAQDLSRGEMAKLFLLLESGEHVGKKGVCNFTTRKFIVEPVSEDTSFGFDGERYDNIPTMFKMRHNFASIIV
jgi:diacylglycerol kinase family enzyme